MAKQLNTYGVSVKFTADSRELQKSMKTLQSQLQDLSVMKFSIDDGSLKKATESARDLQKYLQQATDASTGNLDISKLSTALKQAGRDMNDISADLLKLGPQGNQAFVTLARSVAQAQIPLKKTNKMMDELWTTMKNTARWQLTSSVMNGFMGAVSKAIGYAEDLNESLTNIRIVTGQSEAQMDRFAVKANKAAKALSATTTAYSDAALIFYQQGLADNQVEERTNATIKMSQAAGESAKEVSSYMTAIWNNFDDGTKSLEYYGDAMAALGATTAASSAEIAEGLEKFAAIGDTVGLSFEYATAAVATVVDKTQQSADTVGTAFKTIFSRIQGLSLGETLDDGTTLNKYSEALNKVGISIKDQSGELKSMDVVLDELGEKWKLLSQDQQMALAQTVAGTRQYTQLIALMRNYDDFKVNVEVATNSEGTLDEQSKIFQEGWEGAANRAQAALEGFYQAIIDDDAIINIIDGFADLTNGVTKFIDKVGGIETILVAVASFFAQKFSGKISEEVARMGENFNVFTGKAKDDMISLQNTMVKELAKNKKGSSMVEQAEMNSVSNLIAAKQRLAIVSDTLNEQERAAAEYQVATIDKLSQKVELLVQEAAKQQEIIQARRNEIMQESSRSKGDGAKPTGGETEEQAQIKAVVQARKAYKQYCGEVEKRVKAEKNAIKTSKEFSKASNLLTRSMKVSEAEFKKIKEAAIEYTQKLNASEGYTDKFAQSLKDLESCADMDQLSAELGTIEMKLENIAVEAIEATNQLAELDDQQKLHDQNAAAAGLNGGSAAEVIEGYRQEAEAVENVTDALEEQKSVSENLKMEHAVTGIERLTNLASAAGSLYAAYQLISNVGTTLFDDEASTGEKLVSVLTMLSTLLPIIAAYKEAVAIATSKASAAQLVNIGATAKNALAQGGLVAALKAATAAIIANTVAWFGNPITAIIAAVVLAATAVFAGFTASIKANSEALQENADKAAERADASREEVKTNHDKIASYNELLETYKKTGEGKSELDAIAADLAEAYDIEGAALARLTGNYEDYYKISIEAAKKHRAEMREQLENEKDAEAAAGAALLDTAKYADLDGNGSYFKDNGDFGLVLDGWGDETAEQRALKAALKDLENITGVKSDKNDFDITVAGGNPEDIVKLYDALVEAKAEMEEQGKQGLIDLENSGTYNDTVKWLEQMEEDVESYRKHAEELEKIRTELGMIEYKDDPGKFLDLSSAVDEMEGLSTLEEYQAWVDKTSASMARAGLNADEIAEKIEQMTENSLNPAIQSLKTLDKGFDGLESKKGIDKKKAQAYFDSLTEEQQALFWSINFDVATTEEQWNNAIAHLQAQADGEQIDIRLNTVVGAQDLLKEDMSAEDYIKLKDTEGLWGSEKEGLVEFIDFVKMSYEEQYAYLEGLRAKEYQAQTANRLEQRALLEQTMEADRKVAEEKKAALLEEKAVLDKQIEQWGQYSFVSTKAEEERVAAIEQEIAQLEKSTEASLTETQSKLDALDTQITIDLIIEQERAEEALRTALDELSTIADPITSVFDGISNGIKRTMDESGNAIWKFSSEAAQAVSKMYPGFMEGLTMLKDGTFEVSDEIYQKVLSVEEGIVMAKATALTEKMELLAEEYYEEGDKYRELANLAGKIARGEIESEEQKKAAKLKILTAIQNYEQDVSTNILKMRQNLLSGQVTADTEQAESTHTLITYVRDAYNGLADAMAKESAEGSRSTIINNSQVGKSAITTAGLLRQMNDGPAMINADDADKSYTDALWSLKDTGTSSGGGKPGLGDIPTPPKSTNPDALISGAEAAIAAGINLNLGGDGANTREEEAAIYSAIEAAWNDVADAYDAAGDRVLAELADLTASIHKAFEALAASGDKAVEELLEVAKNFSSLTRELASRRRELEQLQKKADNSFGRDSLDIMDQMSDKYDELMEKQKTATEIQRGIVNGIKDTLTERFEGITFDEYGNISNEGDIRSAIDNQLQQAIIDYNARPSGLSDEDEKAAKEKLDAAKKEHKQQTALLDSFNDAIDTLRDSEDAEIDLQYEIWAHNFAKLQKSLTINVNISKDSLRIIELKIKRLGEDFFKSAEKLLLTQGKMDEYKAQINHYTAYKGALDQAYLNGEIGPAEYMEGFQEVKEGIAEQIDQMIELDQQMLHYYGDTLQKADEELRKYTDHMEHLTSVLDHYISLADLLGKKKDYGMMRNFLEGKASTLRDQVEVEKANYAMLQKERDKAKESLDKEIARLGGQERVDDLIQRDRTNQLSEDEKYMLSAYELLKNNWDDAVKATDAAQEAMLEKTEQWVQAMKAVIENNMAEINDTLEKSLTGGTTFDELMDGFDKLNARQEEYLTKTNQMYETTKMIRTANKALDETDNKVAQQKIKNFIEETKSLQGTTKLSKYELEIQQAKYDLLLAEIALEEARNAKSTVRMARDSEGNFGYVYTADQDAVSDAEQGVDDAKNNLYNISLEGQQEYTEKYLQSQQEMFNELTELHEMYINGDIATEEEYQRRKEAILEHYLGEDGVLSSYSKLYGIAVSADAAAMQDNWQTEYAEMTQNTETWKTEVNKYLGEMETQIGLWKDTYVTANNDVGGAFENSETAVKDVKTESSNLATTITGQLLPAMGLELAAVREQTEAYAAQREEILKTIDAYIAMLEQMSMVEKQQGLGFDPDKDYSAAINEYLNAGGQVGDDTYNEMVRQRQLKIEWLKAGNAGAEKADQSYWQFEGDERTREIYEALVAGGQYTIEELAKTLGQDWFKENYMSFEELKEQLREMGIPEEALENLKDVDIENAKATQENADENAADTQANADENAKATQENADENAADTQANADENAADTQANADENAADTQANADENAKATQANADENTETLDATLNDVNQSVKDVKSSVDVVNTSVNTVNTSVGTVNTSIGTVNTSVSSWGASIVGSVKSAASTISSAVGGLANRVTTLEGNVANIRAEMVSFEESLGALGAALDSQSGTTSGSTSGTSSTGSGGGGGGGKAMMEQMQFASGGYTGDWGPEGKLAVLHEKEIVLNASDTENFLSAISIIRDISNMIDFNAGLAGFASLSAAYSNLTNSSALEQTVTITAEFPNATDRYEIEEAFNNLVNHASQYANRK